VTIALAMIAGGEDPVGDGLEHAIGSARDHVDEVCLWANGPSADRVVELAERLNARPGNDALVGAERLREVVARAEAADADIAWLYWDRYATERYGWWPTVVRGGTGRWQGVVHECWRRPGIDRWRHGVGQAGSVHVHPAMLRVVHRDRTPVKWKYLRLLEVAARDPERTPWALAALAHDLIGMDNERVLELLEAQLDGGYDDCEGTFNSYRADNLKSLALLHENIGDPRSAVRYRADWDAYTRKLTDSLGRRAEFLLQLGDEATVKRWAATPPDQVTDVLLPAPPTTVSNVGRNDPCWCGNGKKFKRCHGAS
jgi:hypothetical protein